MRAEAELFYDSTGGGAYNGGSGKDFCTNDSAWTKVSTSLGASNVHCLATATTSAMAGKLNDSTWFCVDTAGAATTTAAGTVTGGTCQ